MSFQALGIGNIIYTKIELGEEQSLPGLPGSEVLDLLELLEILVVHEYLK